MTSIKLQKFTIEKFITEISFFFKKNMNAQHSRCQNSQIKPLHFETWDKRNSDTDWDIDRDIGRDDSQTNNTIYITRPLYCDVNPGLNHLKQYGPTSSPRAGSSLWGALIRPASEFQKTKKK